MMIPAHNKKGYAAFLSRRESITGESPTSLPKEDTTMSYWGFESEPTQLQAEVSARAIRRRLQQSGLSARRPLLGLSLKQNHRQLRRQWCDERRMWTAEWNEVVFTDRSRMVGFESGDTVERGC
ncbi:transposable element Tcb1 transposase [Trichonephila clavipes]|nr:transposable element Tcb1 transposase [Trichonephila clavipes]